MRCLHSTVKWMIESQKKNENDNGNEKFNIFDVVSVICSDSANRNRVEKAPRDIDYV